MAPTEVRKEEAVGTHRARERQTSRPLGANASRFESRAAQAFQEDDLILVDTSVWVDHLGRGDPGLVDLWERSAVVMHPFVVGEFACAKLRDRNSILELLQDLPAAVVAAGHEVVHFIERHALHGKGIGYVDLHLLASIVLTKGARVWTRDLKLRQVAARLGCAYPEPAH